MGSKYANLPDIDTAPDIYETDDVFPSARTAKGDSSDDEVGAAPTRSTIRGKHVGGEGAGREELDENNLISAEEASKKFKNAERKRKPRTQYIYPRSPDTSEEDSDDPESPSKIRASGKAVPLSQRLRMLQSELSTLEAECNDPSNPLLRLEEEDGGVDTGELIMGLVDVRRRLEKIKKVREGRGKLVGTLTSEGPGSIANGHPPSDQDSVKRVDEKEGKRPVRNVVEMDRRVGELEKLVGSSSASLDETSPLPPPLLPLVTRLNMQITLLTQPRHIDSISRRLKLLLSDLERASSAQHGRHSKNPSNPSVPQSQSADLAANLLPLLSRLTPILPHIPHVLTRLRTLSALHASASDFAKTLENLEEEQRRTRESLKVLENAVEKVEGSVKENASVVGANVTGLEGRVDTLLGRLEKLQMRDTNGIP